MKRSLTAYKPAFKFIIDVNVVVFAQDRNGNTYHRITIQHSQDGEIYDSGKTYGYSNAYETTAQKAALNLFKIPTKYLHISGEQVNEAITFRNMREANYLKLDYHVQKN